MNYKKPLLGYTILVTRARIDGDELVMQLADYGASVIYCPTIEIAEPENFALLDQAIDRLHQYDWLIFTSRNAVNAFLNRLEKLEKSEDLLAHLKILVVGSATAKALEKANITPTLIPDRFHAEGALASLQNYYQNNELLAKCRFLFPRAAMGRDVLPIELEKLGATVDLVTAYQTVLPKGAQEKILNIFATKKIDLITFTSPSTINNLIELAAPTPIDSLLKGILIACIGPVTANAVEETGLEVDICPNQSTALALAEQIKNYFG